MNQSLRYFVIGNQQPVKNTSYLPLFPPPTTTIWHWAAKIDVKSLVTIRSHHSQGPAQQTHLIFIGHISLPPLPHPHRDAINSQTPVSCQRKRGPLWLHLYVLTQEPGEEYLCGWDYRADMRRHECNHRKDREHLKSVRQAKRWGEFTQIKSGCKFKRSSNGKSFDPKMTIQMMKVIGDKQANLRGKGRLGPGRFILST